MWKGTVHETTYVTTPPTGGSCGFAFIAGEEYIVYGYDSNHADDGYAVGICSRTTLLAQAQADLDALGQGHAPQAGTGGPSSDQPLDMVASSAWIVILALAAAVSALCGTLVYPLIRP